MSKQKTFGTLLNAFRLAIRNAEQESEVVIWKRNNLMNHKLRKGYKMEQEKIAGKDGEVLVSTKLWKLVDSEQVIVTGKVQTDVITADPDKHDKIKELMGE